MSIPRFYPILDTGAIEQCGGSVTSAAGDLLEAGARIIQLRHKGHFHRELYARAVEIASMCREAGALFVLNDRVDIALLLDCAVHVGQDDLPVVAVRSVGGAGRIVGLSTHNASQLTTAIGQPIDYVALGPIFATGSKYNPDPEVGVAGLRRMKSLASVPLVAIGGITRETAPAVWDAGANSIAVIGDLYPDVRKRAEGWMRLSA